MEPGIGRLGSSASGAPAGCPSLPEILAAAEAPAAPRAPRRPRRPARARHRRRHARADRRGALHRQPLLGPHGLRDRRTRPPRSAPTSSWSPRTSTCRATRACATSTSRPRPSCRRPCEEGFGSCDVLVMAAAVVDFRPRTYIAGKMKKTEATGRPAGPPRAHAGHPRGARRRASARGRRSSASQPSTATERWSTVATSLHGRGWTPSWSTTWVRPASGSTPPTTR